MSFFRYPGGKAKLRKHIIEILNNMFLDYSLRSDYNGVIEYREPFFGGGSIGYNLLKSNPFIDNIWINDKDKGVACLWSAAINDPIRLKELVLNFTPSIEKFDEFKSILTDDSIDVDSFHPADYGFMKLAIHQMSFSGLGTKSGGPLGGRNADNYPGSIKVKYPIDCRWSPEYICKKIDSVSERMRRLNLRYNCCTWADFGEVVSDCENGWRVVMYLDPPYYDKGSDLYQHFFTDNDHIGLAKLLKASNHKWLLSYDDCEFIRDLYSWAKIETISDVGYTIKTSRSKNELLIST